MSTSWEKLKPLYLHHVELSHNSQNISGGEKALIELVKYVYREEPRIRQRIYTSESGKLVYTRLLGSAASSVEFKVIGSRKYEKIHPYVAFYLRSLQQFFHLTRFEKGYRHLIFSHEEFLPTTLHSFFLSLLNPQAKWTFFYHMKAPRLFGGFEGDFTGKFRLPNIKTLRYLFEQGLAYKLTSKCALVITNNDYYKELLSRKYSNPHLYVIKRYSGVNVPSKSSKTVKKYDLAWMGRFHAQKGVMELLDIVEKLCMEKPDISLVVLGGGNRKLEERFKRAIASKDLTNNIDFRGFVIGDERFDILRQAKIFMMTSYYESFGQVNLEAMKCGLPVVAYALPVFGVFTKGMVKVPILDNEKYATEVLKLLGDRTYYASMVESGESFASSFSWEKTSAEILGQIKKLY